MIFPGMKVNILNISCIVLYAVFAFECVNPAEAQKKETKRAKYLLSVNKYTQGDLKDVQIRNTGNAKLIWKRPLEGVTHIGTIACSDGNRFVAFVEYCTLTEKNNYEGLRLVIWQESSGATVLTKPAYLFKDESGFQNLWWSPDHQKILMRTHHSGSADSDSGTLWCLDIKALKIRKIESGVRNAIWLNNDKIKYWLAHTQNESRIQSLK